MLVTRGGKFVLKRRSGRTAENLRGEDADTEKVKDLAYHNLLYQ